MFLTFAAIGRLKHSEDSDIFSVLVTALPFLLSWIAVSPFFGAYSRQATSSLGAVPMGVLPALAVSTMGGLTIRMVEKGYVPPVPFAILSFVVPFVLLCIWRAIFVKVVGATNDGADKDAGALEVFKMISALVRRW